MEKMQKEIRTMTVEALQNNENKMIVEGYAIRFNQPAIFKIGDTEYREIISPSALDKTDVADVPFKYNHLDSMMIMARTKSNTLQLVRDDEGLKIVAELANTSTGRDLYELIRRGDVDKMSFAFNIRKNGDKFDRETRTRTILDIEKLFDVSAVDTPAYESTSISARSKFESLISDIEQTENAEKRKILILKTYL
jgi:HK97 family phage prohead protease